MYPLTPVCSLTCTRKTTVPLRNYDINGHGVKRTAFETNLIANFLKLEYPVTETNRKFVQKICVPNAMF